MPQILQMCVSTSAIPCLPVLKISRVRLLTARRSRAMCRSRVNTARSTIARRSLRVRVLRRVVSPGSMLRVGAVGGVAVGGGLDGVVEESV